jgi:hypothetical protein
LDRLLGLLLYDDGAITHAPTRHDFADPDPDHVAATQLAVDREIEERSAT